MLDELKTLEEAALIAVKDAPDETTLRDLEVHYLGKKGALTKVLKGMGRLEASERPVVGKKANEVRQHLTAAITDRRAALEAAIIAKQCEDPTFDATLPARPPRHAGALHPVTTITYHIEDAFRAMGFAVLDFPEVESDFFNFEALNIPQDHPARDMQDTFWLRSGQLLRTHTSNGQVRAMRQFEPPFRAIFPGRVFRYEEVDASHEHTFHQVEGLMIDRDLSVANLIHAMKTLLSVILEREVTVRLRPGYFPFVEPGFELDIECQVCEGSGCQVCKHSGWVELLPCGLVHPRVLEHGGLDPEQWSGWAFGLGLSRLVMMKYQIEDIRHILSGDLRFVQQFRRG